MSTTFPDVDIQPEPEPLDDPSRTLRGIGDRLRRTAPKDNVTTDEIPPAFEDAKKPPKPASVASLQGRLEAMYATIAIAAMPFDPQWSQEIMVNGPVCAEAWVALARENATVKRVLESMLTVGATGAVVAAHFPIIITAPWVRDRLANIPVFAGANVNGAPTS